MLASDVETIVASLYGVSPTAVTVDLSQSVEAGIGITATIYVDTSVAAVSALSVRT